VGDVSPSLNVPHTQQEMLPLVHQLPQKQGDRLLRKRLLVLLGVGSIRTTTYVTLFHKSCAR